VLSADRPQHRARPTAHAKEQVQLRILEACERMGALGTYSCNPFLLGCNPAFGNGRWNGSRPAPYVNAVLGARTNREGATALALRADRPRPRTGCTWTPSTAGRCWWNHTPVQGSDAFAVLGGAVGRAAAGRIPVIEGIVARPTLDEFTAFCTAFATTSPLATFHMVGITPEAPTRAAALAGGAVDALSINGATIEAETARYTTAASERLDVVTVGCPHASLAQVREVADLLGSARIHAGTTFLLQTNRAIAAQAAAEGLDRRLASAGVDLTDTCHILPAAAGPCWPPTLKTHVHREPRHGSALRHAVAMRARAIAGRWLA
jgi:hypothetical protein